MSDEFRRNRKLTKCGIERGLFGDHAFGGTPEKSMQARLSLDIKYLRESSRFMRVARGRFVLRGRPNEIDGEPSAGSGRDNQLSEYFAEPRKLRTPSESVLCTPEDRFSNILTFQGIDGDYGAIIPRLLNDTFYPFQCS